MIDEKAILIKEKAAKAFGVDLDQVEVVNRLMGGMSHLTYLIQVNDQLYTYRIIGKDGNLFVDRSIEFDNLNRIKPLGINNETVYFDQKTGEKAAKFVEGEVLTNLDYNKHLDEVVKTLKTLHQTSIRPHGDYGLLERLDLYESYTNENDPKYDKLKKIWLDTYLKDRAHMPKVFCHNDAQRSNMVIGKNQLYLLDWEYAAYNEFYYDIASFGNVAFEDALILLNHYLGREASVEEQNLVRFYRAFQALQWHQVATRKDMIGLSKDVGFDFKMLALKYLNLAEQLLKECNLL